LNRILRYALTALIILSLAGITSLYIIFDSRPGKTDNELAQIIIRDGSSLSSIAQQLYEADIISSPESFKVAAKLLNRTRAIYPGAYSIQKGLSNTEAIEALAHAKAIEITVTIPEGLRSDEIIGLLSRQLNLDSLKMMDLLTDSPCSA
jgi:UPF0755 protein